MERYKFWFHDRDKKGQPLDENLLKTAEEIAPLLTRYRRDEIDCESTANDLLQDAIEAASNSIRKNRVANTAGYLVSIYKRFVDKYLERKKRLIPLDDQFIEELVNAERASSSEEWMNNRLILEKLLKLMDPDTRRICRWRLEGYSESQIAKRLGISPNNVCVRFTRGFNEAAAKLLRDKRRLKAK
jgi:RNA polymerase sigma factor (sigma-70 family)